MSKQLALTGLVIFLSQVSILSLVCLGKIPIPSSISNQLSIGLLFAFFFIMSIAFVISGATDEPKTIMEKTKLKSLKGGDKNE